MKLIIDANNIAYRAHATSKLTTKGGQNVSAIYGTLKMLQSYLKPTSGGWKNKIFNALKETNSPLVEENFTELITCWDGGKSKWRKAFYPEYKAHREKKRSERSEEDKQNYSQFLEQMEELHDVLPYFGIKSMKLKGWEADDLIYASTVNKEDDELAVIVSTDQDMLQLVSDSVFVWSPTKEVLVTPANFGHVTGVSKSCYLTYRALVGDKSDNITGIHGIGEKKAKGLIIKYGDMNGILSHREELMKSVVTKRIIDNVDVVVRNQKLMDMRLIPVNGATIRGDNGEHVDIGNLNDYVKGIIGSETSFEDAFVRMFLMSKEFVSLVADFHSWTKPFKDLVKELTSEG